MKSDFFNMNSLEEIKENGGFKAFFLYFYQDFFKILNDNFNFEFNSEKYGSILLIFTFIFFSLIKGSPLLNNYYGIYREYETVSYNSNGDEVYDYTEEGYYIVEKFNRERIDFLMNTLSKKNEFDEESNFRVKKKGFIFAQSALIDGYRANKNYFYGFFSYLHSLIIFGFEKLITVLIYFFLPFTSTIFINNFLNRKNAS